MIIYLSRFVAKPIKRTTFLLLLKKQQSLSLLQAGFTAILASPLSEKGSLATPFFFSPFIRLLVEPTGELVLSLWHFP
jgi:hypothetical protein